MLNNNVVITHNHRNQEIVVMGRGLAFQKRVGDKIDTSKIEKTFVLENEGNSDKLAQILEDTSEKYLHIVLKIIDYARSKLPYLLDEYLYVALTDHISFAITRKKQGITIRNPLQWEIRKYYKEEYNIALKALDIIEEATGIRLDEDEVASITLHLVNSQLSGENMEMAVQVTEVVNDILNIVKYHFKMDLDENSINYERFLTHLRYFAIRLVRGERIEDTIDEFFHEQVKMKYAEAYECTLKIEHYIKNELNWKLLKDEKVYLTVHIHRVTKRYQYS